MDQNTKRADATMTIAAVLVILAAGFLVFLLATKLPSPAVYRGSAEKTVVQSGPAFQIVGEVLDPEAYAREKEIAQALAPVQPQPPAVVLLPSNTVPPSAGGAGGSHNAPSNPSKPVINPPTTSPPPTTPPPPTTAPPPPREITLGDTVRAAITVSNTRDLLGAQFDLSFDPGVLQFTSATEGPFLDNGVSSAALLIGPTVTGGQAKNIVLLRTAMPGVNGTGTLVTLNFKAIADGSSGFAIRNPLLSNSQSQPLQSPLTVVTTIA